MESGWNLGSGVLDLGAGTGFVGAALSVLCWRYASGIRFSPQGRAGPNRQSRGRGTIGAKVQAQKSAHKNIKSFEELFQGKKFYIFLEVEGFIPREDQNLTYPFWPAAPLSTIERTRDTQRE